MSQIARQPWEQWTQHDQARRELKLIRDFFTTADRAGLSIPEDSYDIRELLRTVDKKRVTFVREWPPGRLFALIALAQHHGIATRLLGWTYSPWIAAYFAAESVIRQLERGAVKRRENEEKPQIVVWAFDLDLADMSMPDAEDTDKQEDRVKGFIEVVTTPYAQNRNLAAQRGVHLLYRSVGSPRPTDVVRREPLGDALQRVHASVSRHMTALYKFRLPASEAGRLLRLLAKYGATAATIFPGFDGVARALREQRKWKS